jgi:hypothetical protein
MHTNGREWMTECRCLAFEIATNWLAGLGIDIAKLETKYRRTIIQWRFYPDGQSGETECYPFTKMEWRGFILRSQRSRETAVVTVTVFGATKELVEHHILDPSLFSRQRSEILNAEKLLAISNDAFRALGPLQRSNLVAEFTRSAN